MLHVDSCAIILYIFEVFLPEVYGIACYFAHAFVIYYTVSYLFLDCHSQS